MKRRTAVAVIGAAPILLSRACIPSSRSAAVKKELKTDKAPQAIGPYSQGIFAGPFLFCSGQIPLVPETGQIVSPDFEAQTRQVLQNIGGLLAAAGSSFDRVVKTTVFLKDMNHFAAMNKIYAEFFKAPAPARSAVEVARLPKDVLIEIEVIALV